MPAPVNRLSFPRNPSSLQAAWPWLAATATGGLLVLCFPPWNQGWLCWFALTPLIAAIFATPAGGARRGIRVAALGYVTGFILITGSFWWLGTLALLYQNRLLYSLPVLVALYMALYVAFWSWITHALLAPAGTGAERFRSSARNLLTGCVSACAWISLEWVRTWLFGGFGWNPLGVALHQDLAMIQIVEITGVPGLSFLIVFVNVMAVILVRRIISEFGPVFLTRIRWEFSVTMAVVAGVFAYGVRAVWRDGPAPGVSLRAVAIQPNIPQADKWDPALEEGVFRKLDRLTSLAALSAPPPQLFIWPESATPRGMFADNASYQFFRDEAAHAGSALLSGTVDFDFERREDYNVAVLLSEHGEKQQFYRKLHLVPFGEYLPLRPVFAWLAGQLVPADFTPGSEYTLLELPDPPIRLAALICFEDTLGDLTRRFVQRGAQVLVNVTNDGWFAKSPAAEQHLANALFRAVETRRPLIRCGNTGVTCSVDVHGRVDLWLKPFEEGFSIRDIRVPVETKLTFYTRHGDWFTTLAAIIALLGCARAIICRRPKPEDSRPHSDLSR